jgi:nitrogen fixation/metabolism regulation signal transduction histidine kinase
MGSFPESEQKKGIKESLEGIEKNVEYINKIVSDFQDFARKEAPQFETVDVEKQFREYYRQLIFMNILQPPIQ